MRVIGVPRLRIMPRDFTEDAKKSRKPTDHRIRGRNPAFSCQKSTEATYGRAPGVSLPSSSMAFGEAAPRAVLSKTHHTGIFLNAFSCAANPSRYSVS
jgi:hypothetical protein